MGRADDRRGVAAEAPDCASVRAHKAPGEDPPGGAALAGFYLGHRQTADLDLFVTSDVPSEGEGALRMAAQEVGAAMEGAGFRVDDALPLAMQKDGGLTHAQLAWVLSQIVIPDGAALPGGVTPAALRDFARSLVTRLTRQSFPR